MHLTGWLHVVAVLFVLCDVVTFLIMISRIWRWRSNEFAKLQRQRERLKRVSSQLEIVLSQFAIMKIKNQKLSFLFRNAQGPSTEYENLRRRIYSNTKELWYYVHSKISQTDSVSLRYYMKLLVTLAHRKRFLLSDLEKLHEQDGYQEWRRLEAANVSDLVQSRLHYLQNPHDCRKAKKIICNCYHDCGVGCQLHYLAYCLIVAYATERTLILQKTGRWKYGGKGWDAVLRPLSNTCTNAYNDKVLPWAGKESTPTPNAKVVALTFPRNLRERPNYIIPLAVPKDLAHRIVRFNGDPSAWWIGQMFKYILKPQLSIQKIINGTIAKRNYKVGVHIRRTDKFKEAPPHHIDEYMEQVIDYYKQLEITRPVSELRTYVATDDDTVLNDVIYYYSKYKIFGDPFQAKTAKDLRFTPQSLIGVLIDLYTLSTCDYIVCTFSSNIGRLSYEMMQANRVDASDSFFSLDDLYYFNVFADRKAATIIYNSSDHRNIVYHIGDVIDVKKLYNKGYGYDVDRQKINMTGLIPWYKTIEHVAVYPFPLYKQVPTWQKNRHPCNNE